MGTGTATEKGGDARHNGKKEVDTIQVSQHGEREQINRLPSWLMVILSTLGEQWFLIALGLLIAIASQVQVSAAQQHIKQTIVTYLCVSIIFFITGCTLETKTLIQNYSRWKTHLFVQVQCFLMTSAVVFGIVSATATSKHFMDPGLLVGLIFFSCVATTISSNVVMTRQAHGNTALTVVQTTVGNFIGVFITPALVVMYTSVNTWFNAVLPASSGHFAEIYRRVLKQLGLSIYVPLVVGQIVRHFFPNTCRKVFVDWKLNKVGSISLLLIIWQTYDSAFATHSFDTVAGSNKVFLVFISIGLYLLFFGIAFSTAMLWLPKKDVVAICYCVPAKGPSMGVPMATTIFAGLDPTLAAKIQIPIVIYQGLQLAFGAILVPIFRRWVDAEKQRKKQDEEANRAVESVS
jgi:solute carrier family 10 (sodium/bile acid cotransporter), member 7